MIWVGTSGYNYPEWKGSFYPADLSAAKMLPYYAARFPTVEINYTFYRMPTEKLLAGWASQTPSPFKLTLKAPRRITHDHRLKNCGSLVTSFCQTAGTLGQRRGEPAGSRADLHHQITRGDTRLFDELGREASASKEMLPVRLAAARAWRALLRGHGPSP